jgi:hypothetical protein
MAGADKVGDFVEWIDGRIRRDSDRDEGAHDVRRLKLSTVLSRCGWSNRSVSRMEHLTARLGERGLHCDPPLTSDDLARDQFVQFSRMLPPLPVQTSPLEADLIRYLAANAPKISPLDQYGSDITTEYPLPSGQRIDLLFKDKRRRRWLVVEVENKGKNNQQSPAQLHGYMTEVRDKVLPPGFDVEGMVISPDADPAHVEVLMTMNAPGRVHWLTFSIVLQLQPAPGSVLVDDDQ